MKKHIPFLAFCFLCLSTSLWWTLAFWPISPATPDWLVTARTVCFGMVASGLPDAGGWLMLTAAPLSMLIALLVAWQAEIQQSFVTLYARSNTRLLFFLIIFLLAIHSLWLANKVRAGMLIANQDYASLLQGPLPEDYPTINKPAADFELQDQDAEIVKLSALASQRQVLVVSFAFANCKTICPAITRNLVEAVKDFDPQQVALLIITLDPRRDTAAALKSWATRLKLPSHVRLLTGTVEQVEKVLDDYQIPYKRDEKTGDVDHPALTNVVDSKGQIIYALGNAPQQWITAAVSRVLIDTSS